MSSSIHKLTHKHTMMSKPNMGDILVCGNRFTGRVASAWYRPDEWEEWVQFPVDMDVLQQVCSSSDRLEALAYIENAWFFQEYEVIGNPSRDPYKDPEIHSDDPRWQKFFHDLSMRIQEKRQ